MNHLASSYHSLKMSHWALNILNALPVKSGKIGSSSIASWSWVKTYFAELRQNCSKVLNKRALKIQILF